jgi:hypothetical protein
MKRLAALALSAAMALVAGPASAALFDYSTDFSAGVGGEWSISAPTNSAAAGILGQLGGGGSSATLSQSSAIVGSGVLQFDLLLFRTMDGVNAYTDQFNITINGDTRYQAAFGTIAGGGIDTVFLNPDGATFTRTDGLNDVHFGSRHITIGFAAVAGANTFQFSYPSLQSFDDEAWGLDNVVIGEVVRTTPGIPEPATWAMLLTGFFGLGTFMRRRRAAVA